jgi:hypothetical protein
VKLNGEKLENALIFRRQLEKQVASRKRGLQVAN